MRELTIDRAKEERYKNKWVFFKGKKRKLSYIINMSFKETVDGVEVSHKGYKLEFSNGKTFNVNPKDTIDFISVRYEDELVNIERYVKFMNPVGNPMKMNFKVANLIRDMKEFKYIGDPGYREIAGEEETPRPLIYIGHLDNVPCYIDLVLSSKDMAFYVLNTRVPLRKFSYVYDNLLY